MVLPEYLADIAREMRVKSTSIRRDFATHHLSAGENREDLVRAFLTEHLPKRFGVESGMVISHEGRFSNQADLVVVDALNNSPLYGTSRNQLWPVEAVYSLLEIKTTLSPTELKDSIAKGRRFKTLQRRFFEAGQGQRVFDSLFVIWGFDCPTPETLKSNVVAELTGVPLSEQPDFIVVPDHVLISCGSYLELSMLGQLGSTYRAQLHQQRGGDLSALLPPALVMDLGENALLAWYVWFDSWLRQAGSRLTTPSAYLPVDQTFGVAV
ncbi:hypothetical protein BJL95_09220 [Methylomonas sp. LWB]|uniref:DUF6602 domain-containing protein n=1 Tax=Methylomonas sp. LWB TaxID=1905845 RepID=UPI0008DAA516|nr:DUF6602 domain-containing protein [Methylomonas sp. LWB]OHX38467.1 hypothetical protein BJL95_09220 [Methylomonas sp. LWB]